MLRKEMRKIARNRAYWLLMLLPFALAFFMSEGTQSYLDRFSPVSHAVAGAKEVILYQGVLLDARTQFAVSELSFMLLMVATLLGNNIFEERRLRIWDRVIDKNRFLAVKSLVHYLYAAGMIVVSLGLYRLAFGLRFPAPAVFVFFTLPVLGLCIGLAAGVTLPSRAVVSNTTMMTVMLFGYLGGALSLSSVLATTNIMRWIMHLSPITAANRLIFAEMLGHSDANRWIAWAATLFGIGLLCLLCVKRGFQHDRVL